MLKPLILLAMLVASTPVVAPPVPPDTQYIRSQFGQCPDGTVIEAALYDTDPNDPEAMAIVWKRGDHVVGVVDAKTKTVFVTALGRTLPLDEARLKYPTPCALPDGAGV